MQTHQILSYVAPGDIVFDIGANIGDKANMILNVVQARLVCVEPQPKCVAILLERFGKNPDVTIVPSGVASRDDIGNLSICESNDTLSTFSEKWKQGRFKNEQWTQTATVDMVRLDTLVEQYGNPRFCKIDVEGFEVEVLLGLSKKIGIISFEFTSEFIDDCFVCIQCLISLGYRYFNLSLGETPTLYYPKFVKFEEIIQLLYNSRNNQGLWGDIYAS